MADNNTSRFRSGDAFGRAPGSSAPANAPANDPLAELARLIGQNDPFADFGPRPEQGQQPEQGGYEQYPTQPYQGQPAEPYAPEPAPAYQAELQPIYQPEPAQQYPSELPPMRFGSPPSQPASHDEWPATPAPATSYQQPQESYGLPPPMRSLPGFDQPAYSEPMIQPPDDYRPERTAADPLPSFLTSTDRQPQHPSFAQQPFGQQPPIYPPQPEAGAMPAPHDDEFYEDEPRGGRRKGLLTVAAVLVLAVVGTASAVAYRNYFSGSGTSGPPPVIRASNEPSKVAPPAASAATSTDPAAGKFNYDRFADRGKDEKIVGREEKPLDQRDLTRSQPPSVATPPARPAAGTAPNAIGQTRTVRTVPITPNSNDVAMNAPSVTPDNQMLPASPARQGVNFPPPAAPAAKPVESRPEPAAPPTTRATPPRTISTARAQPQTSGNAPLSLSPDAADQSPPPSASAYRDASPPSRQANAAPVPRSTSTASTGGGGRFHVQVSSQKSESDAESSYRSIQSKYSSVLGGQPHTVRRADLGAKGVYYRAMVGPFGTREQAVQLCSSLKSAGGDCVVQAN